MMVTFTVFVERMEIVTEFFTTLLLQCPRIGKEWQPTIATLKHVKEMDTSGYEHKLLLGFTFTFTIENLFV